MYGEIIIYNNFYTLRPFFSKTSARYKGDQEAKLNLMDFPKHLIKMAT